MSNSFFGINIGLKAIQTQQRSLDVTGHNIANANNENYSRQRAVQTATDPYPYPGVNSPAGAGQVGTGVKISDIERIKNEFIEGQIREQGQEQGKWSKLSEGLHRVELIFNEPSDSSLNSVLGHFWESLQDLGNNPEDPATRATVQQRSVAVTDSFHTLSNQLLDYKEALSRDINSTVDQINSLATRIADLNKQIANVEFGGNHANDLMDKRDELFNKLNQKVNVRGRIDEQNRLNISINGSSLVRGTEIDQLEVVRNWDDNGEYENQIFFTDVNQEADITSGELKGLIDTREITANTYLDELDKMAEGLKTRFNEVHQQGYDQNGDRGKEFFTVASDAPHAAANIQVTREIQNDSSKIAAGNYSDDPQIVTIPEINLTSDYQYQLTVDPYSGPGSDYEYTIKEMDGDTVLNSFTGRADNGSAISTPSSFASNFKFTIHNSGKANISLLKNPGSASNAFALARAVKNDTVIDDNASITEHYQSVISTLGVRGQRANQMEESQNVVVDQLKNQREGISGVSLDEEMANIIKYQQAYNAAAKIITTTNSILDALMNVIR